MNESEKASSVLHESPIHLFAMEGEENKGLIGRLLLDTLARLKIGKRFSIEIENGFDG